VPVVHELFVKWYRKFPRSVEYSVACSLSVANMRFGWLPPLVRTTLALFSLYFFFQTFNYLRPSIRKKGCKQLPL